MLQFWLSLPKECSDIVSFTQESKMLHVYTLKCYLVAYNAYVQKGNKSSL